MIELPVKISARVETLILVNITLWSVCRCSRVFYFLQGLANQSQDVVGWRGVSILCSREAEVGFGEQRHREDRLSDLSRNESVNADKDSVKAEESRVQWFIQERWRASDKQDF